MKNKVLLAVILTNLTLGTSHASEALKTEPVKTSSELEKGIVVEAREVGDMLTGKAEYDADVMRAKLVKARTAAFAIMKMDRADAIANPGLERGIVSDAREVGNMLSGKTKYDADVMRAKLVKARTAGFEIIKKDRADVTSR